MSRTPGPWRVTSGGQVTARFYNRHFGDVSPLSLYRSAEVRRANARLIAAAPEMLEALEALLPDIECRCGEAYTERGIHESNSLCHHIEAVKAAIAKATGEEVDHE